VDCGKTKPRTEMRETRQQVRLRHPVTLLLVRCVGRGVSAGGHSRPGAMAREGASRRSRRARARAKERARLDPSASSLRVDVEGFERNIVASTSSTRVWSFACEGAGETRGTGTRRRGRPRLRYPYQVPDPKRSDVPLSGGGPVCGHPPRRLTRARRKRRRVARSRRASPMASAWGRGPRKRACAENADSIEIARVRPRAPKMRRPRAPSCAGRASSGPRTERRSASATKATPRVSKAPHLGGDV
jgi:hypothetical protein